MNIEELKARLMSEKIKPDMYSLNGGLPNEMYCIARKSELWEVYYSERGNKTGLKTFQNEEDACMYFYTLVITTLREMKLL